jgi:hypothetical protein
LITKGNRLVDPEGRKTRRRRRNASAFFDIYIRLQDPKEENIVSQQICDRRRSSGLRPDPQGFFNSRMRLQDLKEGNVVSQQTPDRRKPSGFLSNPAGFLNICRKKSDYPVNYHKKRALPASGPRYGTAGQVRFPGKQALNALAGCPSGREPLL